MGKLKGKERRKGVSVGVKQQAGKIQKKKREENISALSYMKT